MKKETVKIILAVLAVPLAIWFFRSDINSGWAFLMGIAYRGIAETGTEEGGDDASI